MNTSSTLPTGTGRRNVTVLAASLFVLAAGEELWLAYMPAYLTALGASGLIVGLYGSSRDLLDSLYQYPGGWMADRLGRRKAFLIFVTLACVGYLIFLFTSSWIFVFVGLAFAMAWSSMASPAIFAVIGDSLPRERRAIGFTVQSILKRVPVVIAPVIGGSLILALGIIPGVADRARDHAHPRRGRDTDPACGEYSRSEG